MQAIILAAGRGSRLEKFNNGNPKALIELDKAHLIDYQISMLRYFGIIDICIVIGYEGDMIKSVIGDNCHYINNTKYADTNSLYSLWLARDWVNDDLIVINSDVLAHPNIFWHLVMNQENSLVYDSDSGTDEENMKIAIDEGRLLDISKSLCIDESKGESLGILKFQSSATKLLFSEAEKALISGGTHQWAPAAVQSFAKKTPVKCIDVAGLPWVEIDYGEDLKDAMGSVWPEIQKSINAPPYNQAFELLIHSNPKRFQGE